MIEAKLKLIKQANDNIDNHTEMYYTLMTYYSNANLYFLMYIKKIYVFENHNFRLILRVGPPRGCFKV